VEGLKDFEKIRKLLKVYKKYSICIKHMEYIEVKA